MNEDAGKSELTYTAVCSGCPSLSAQARRWHTGWPSLLVPAMVQVAVSWLLPPGAPTRASAWYTSESI